MMRTDRFIETENSKLLMDIVELRVKLSNLYNSTGPNTSEYVSLSIKLDCLMNEYFDEKIAQLV
jgi:Spo0E like sporulation regulatory protein